MRDSRCATRWHSRRIAAVDVRQVAIIEAIIEASVPRVWACCNIYAVGEGGGGRSLVAYLLRPQTVCRDNNDGKFGDTAGTLCLAGGGVRVYERPPV